MIAKKNLIPGLKAQGSCPSQAHVCELNLYYFLWIIYYLSTFHYINYKKILYFSYVRKGLGFHKNMLTKGFLRSISHAPIICLIMLIFHVKELM